MTDTEIEAGPECDILVAEAVAGGSCAAYAPSGRGVEIKKRGRFVPFHPSTDWNDAMYAAEKFGLFHATGPLAICRAILKLAAEKQT